MRVWFVLAGLVAFRQHLQNLARTKGILELNKVQMLVEQMGSGTTGGLVGPQHHLHNLLEVSLLYDTQKHTRSSFLHTSLQLQSLYCSDFVLDNKKNLKPAQAPRLLCNPGEAAKCGLFTVSRPPGAQSRDQNECSHC